MSKSREYLAIKNFVHNELGLSKEDFISLLKKAVADEARAYVKRAMQSDPEKYVDNIVRQEVARETKNLISGRTFSNSSRELMQTIGKEIAKQITVTVKEN